MRRRSILLTFFMAAALTLGACASEVKPPASPPASLSPAISPTVSPVASPTGSLTVNKPDAMVGRWPGVEDTYLDITKKGDKYSIVIANLDGPKTFEGTAKGDSIEFTRNGKTETIKTATGAETGMKYLEKEKDCLVVTKGSEGFCRKN